MNRLLRINVTYDKFGDPVYNTADEGTRFTYQELKDLASEGYNVIYQYV